MVKEAQRYFSEKMRDASSVAGEAPAELKEIEARLVKLRERLARGDYGDGMDKGDLQAVIQRTEGKRTELVAAAKTERPA